MKNRVKYFLAICSAALFSVHCTDLTETPYSIITKESYYASEMNVKQYFARVVARSYQSLAQSNHYAQEHTADHMMAPKRDGSHFYDGGMHERMHYHTWTIDDEVVNGWSHMFGAVTMINDFIRDMGSIGETVNIDRDVIDNYVAQCRGMRAWLYMRLLDQFRNIPIVTETDTEELPFQAKPEDTFKFIESEIAEIMPILNKKGGTEGNGIQQGEWTQGACAMTLVRLYLNAEVWIGEDRLDQCEQYCKKIIAGEYGHFEIDDRWDAPFDWDNVNSKEIIFAFPSNYAGTKYVYDGRILQDVGPFNSRNFFASGQNSYPRFGITPGRDIDGEIYEFDLGKPIVKLQEYPDDLRLKRFKYLGNSEREGMFLHGYIEDNVDPQKTETINPNGYVMNWPNEYVLYIRDQVGIFRDTPPDQMSPNPSGNENGKFDTPVSSMGYADENSGWFMVKYPIYPSTDPGISEADFAVFRLAETIYTLAEINLRRGQIAPAVQLLNSVRHRNFPADLPDDSWALTEAEFTADWEQEMLDEWGREFLGEGYRRTILIRFGVFNTGEWWDKQPDADDHTKIFPLHRDVTGANPNLIQNPGYN